MRLLRALDVIEQVENQLMPVDLEVDEHRPVWIIGGQTQAHAAGAFWQAELAGVHPAPALPISPAEIKRTARRGLRRGADQSLKYPAAFVDPASM